MPRLLVVVFCVCSPLCAADYELHEFGRQQLTDVYYSEGVNIGEINGDGHVDVVHGPFWFAGPDFKQKFEIYPAKPQPRERYADNFFSWVYDVNGDSHNDVFVVGFPGTPAYVYENPGPEKINENWKKHQVFDWVSNESPHLTNLVGDELPELVCTRDGRFGWATVNVSKTFEAWTFHAISGDVATKRFGHGLGVGDVDGDGRSDVLMSSGWFQQPESLEGDPLWTFHKHPFAAAGAEMYAYDVDDDGDNDVITSLSAHNFGLAWHEQVKGEEGITFKQHLIMGSKPEENKYGLVFSELHSVQLADMDGDGLKDIITGKTYWSHHKQSPMWNAGAVVYWFKLVRGKKGVDWVPYQADENAGIGRQIIIGDVNKDKRPDIIVGGMQGAHVLRQSVKKVDAATWRSFQPKAPKDLAAGLSPEEAAAQITVPSGFRARLAAGEPDVHQPIAMTIDHRGRLWIAEAHTYPIRAPEGEGKDKIIILEDKDKDGSFETRKVFTEGLNLVSGLEVGFGGVWVGAAPYFMFIPDADGDDKPDAEPQILLDGFGYQDTHETLNAFNWGPDGWLYGCHGVFTHSKVGKPGTPDAERTPMNAAVWRYHPIRHEFDVFARGTSNPWGVDFNDNGHAFITACVIPHLWHIIQGARYHRQGGRHFNPYVFDDIKTIADHAHYVGNLRDHAWWGHEPQAAGDTLAAGGGHAHCGAMVYLGDSFPPGFRNQIFMNNIHGNRVNQDTLERHGSGYVGHHGKDLLLANDRWYRGINLRYGPDGSVYVIDWYDKNACHRRTPEIWDRSNGRVFNISYGQTEPVTVDLEKLSDAELVELHLHKNDWYVRIARRILQHRAATNTLAKSTRGQLAAIMNDNPDVTRRLRGMWTLHAIGGLTEDESSALLTDADENIRSWAIQLELEDQQISSGQLAQLTKLAAEDQSALVRLYLTSALQRLPLAQRWDVASALVAHAEDAEDHNLPLMNWYGIEPLVAENPGRALELAAAAKIPLIAQYIIRRAASDNAILNDLVARLAEVEEADAQQLVLQEMLAAFEGRVNIPMPASWKQAYERLTGSDNATVREQTDQIAILFGDKRVFPRMRSTLTNAKAPVDQRRKALDILVRGRDAEAAPALKLALKQPELRGPALRALTAYDDPGIPASVLALYSGLPDAEKRDAINTLASRPTFALALLDAIGSDKIPRTDLHAYNVRQLRSFNNKQLIERIRSVWGEIRETSQDKKKEIARYKAALKPARLKAADRSHGRLVFTKTCATCHTLFGEGEKVGPDITGSNRANLDYILENVVDPSAVLGKDYRMTMAALVDGRVVSGLVTKETDSALTIRTINDTLIVAKDDIDERKLSEISMMPKKLLEPLKPNEVRDLIAYLASPTQVALRGPRAPIDPKTKRVPGALEGESLEVLGKTAGTTKNQPMGNFPADRWSGNDHLWWTGAKPGAKLELEVPVKKTGAYDVEIVLTKARDYGIIQLALNGKPLGGPVDLYNRPDVITTGVLSFSGHELKAGAASLSIQIVGANAKADESFMIGIDYVRLVPSAAKKQAAR